MRELAAVTAVLALTARRERPFAQQRLREPQSKPLLPDSRWSVQQEARGKLPILHPLQQARAQSGVAINFKDRHAGIWHA